MHIFHYDLLKLMNISIHLLSNNISQFVGQNIYIKKSRLQLAVNIQADDPYTQTEILLFWTICRHWQDRKSSMSRAVSEEWLVKVKTFPF